MTFFIQENSPAFRAQNTLTEQSWIDAAVQHIIKDSVGDIHVEKLARDIGVTKGSFYWHFRNRQHLLQRVLEQWTERATIRITEWSKLADANENSIERIARLLALPANTSEGNHGAEIELAVRSWARRDDAAADIVAKIDKMRFENFVELISEFGFSEEETRKRASIALAFMLGDAFLKLGLSQADRNANARVCAEIIARPISLTSNFPSARKSKFHSWFRDRKKK